MKDTMLCARCRVGDHRNHNEDGCSNDNNFNADCACPVEYSTWKAFMEQFRAATPPGTPSAAAMRAAEEIDALLASRLRPDVYVNFAPANQEIAAIITRHLVATPAVAPEALSRASKLCRSTIPGARVELIFQNLEDAQAVHKWLCGLTSPVRDKE